MQGSAEDDRSSTGQVSRQEAIENGDTFYFTGEPCKRGHVSKRYVCDRKCVACTQRESVRERKRRYRRKWAKTEEGREKHREYMREYMEDANLKYKYGITPEEYMNMLEEQGGVCWVCGSTGRENRRLEVDHDHETGEVRHLLCGKCNRLEGRMKSLAKRGGQDAIDRLLSGYQEYWH